MIFKLGIFLNKDKKYQHLGNQSKMNKNENTVHKISFHTSSLNAGNLFPKLKINKIKHHVPFILLDHISLDHLG